MARPALEVADVFRDHGAAWRHANRGHVSLLQLKVMSAIESCRTAALGGHVARCEDCAHTTIAYNSCRNRHCPKCQGAAAREWMAAREAELLPIPYFHVVFTLPSAVGDIAYQNKAVIYDLLFKASSETMLRIAADPKHLGARIGITSVWHTWGSAMTHHPHLHMIVPGGGLSRDGGRWISCKPNFLLPVRVLSKLFRRLMLETGGTPSGQAAVPRLTRASGRCEDIRGVPRSTQEEALVRLRQAAVRRPESRARLSVTVYAPRRHLEPSPDRSRPAERHVQGQGLQDRRPRPVHDDDARRRRVHPPVPHPRAAQRLPSHPPLRLVRQRESRRDDRASARTLGTGNACGRRGGRNRSGGGAGTRPALPLLWRPHVRHRDLRCRLPTTLPADGNEDRYLMSETATFRTRTTKGFPRWSMTRYAAARPNTWLALHSAPRAPPKRIVNAQSKPISQTGGHNNVIPEPRRLPHTHIRPIKSP